MGALIVLVAGRAPAQSEPIALDARTCTTVDTGELRRILALERRLANGPGALHVELSCDHDRALLRGAGASRVLELASVPEPLRPRLLALAIAELRTPVAPLASTAPAALAPVRPQRFRLSIAAHGQRSSLFAAGAELGFSARLSAWIAWQSTATFTQGSLAIDHGDLRVRHASLGSGAALQRELGLVTLAAGGGVRAGWLGLRGLPRERGVRGQRFDTWFVGPSAFGSVALRFLRHGFGLLSLSLTHTVRELRADVSGGRARRLSPWLAGASLGVGASW